MLHIEIEATNQCNTRCLHCPHESITRPLGKMAWDTYQTVIDKIFASDANVTIEFAGMGEPMLNPLVYQFIGNISERSKTSLTTNASALTPQNITHLIEAGLDRLTISFNGADKESYELMMGGLNFEQAATHLGYATQMSRGTRMEVAANVSVTKQTQNKLVAIKDYLNRTGVETIFFSKCHNRGGYFNNPSVCDTPMPPTEDKPRCDIFTSTLFVAWNGDVLSCCHDLAGTNKLGNLISDNLEEILLQRQGIAGKGVNFEICRKCNDMYRYMNDFQRGISLSDWVYALYTPETKLLPYPEMLRWVYALYAQENKSEYFFKLLWAGQSGLQRPVSQQSQIDIALLQMQSQIAEKESALNNIKYSKAWKIALLFRRIRVFLAPPNTRRARTFQRLINIFFPPLENIGRNIKFKEDLALIRSSGLFDKRWYLTHNPDVAQVKADPSLHYLQFGGFEGRDPGPNFCSAWYLDTYEDVKKNGVNPLVHYLKLGREEGRAATPDQALTVQPMERVL